eukprot:TRINITY_DN1698_c0_g3_i1.p5 TRINITY_DN1698_c0_g3~~TRINITY_DN1698_c0_g3_i1.p5  ORF type:complete len:197 (-),score=-13.58 TRINITY_DN1698_c0_g3_i1:98-688(-)
MYICNACIYNYNVYICTFMYLYWRDYYFHNRRRILLCLMYQDFQKKNQNDKYHYCLQQIINYNCYYYYLLIFCYVKININKKLINNNNSNYNQLFIIGSNDIYHFNFFFGNLNTLSKARSGVGCGNSNLSNTSTQMYIYIHYNCIYMHYKCTCNNLEQIQKFTPSLETNRKQFLQLSIMLVQQRSIRRMKKKTKEC